MPPGPRLNVHLTMAIRVLSLVNIYVVYYLLFMLLCFSFNNWFHPSIFVDPRIKNCWEFAKIYVGKSTSLKTHQTALTLVGKLFQVLSTPSVQLKAMADTKIVTLEELLANKSKENFYILIHGKGK